MIRQAHDERLSISFVLVTSYAGDRGSDGDDGPLKIDFISFPKWELRVHVFV